MRKEESNLRVKYYEEVTNKQHWDKWLAEMLRLGILPEGYIYPKEERPIRDLLRKRSHIVRLRTALIVSLQNIITRNLGVKLKANDIRFLTKIG